MQKEESGARVCEIRKRICSCEMQSLDARRGARETSAVYGPLIPTKVKLPTLRFTGNELRISNGRGQSDSCRCSLGVRTFEWLFKLRINMLAVSANGGVQHWPRARSIRYDFSQSSHLWNGNRKETARRTGLEEKYERSFFLMKRPVLLCESSINKRNTFTRWNSTKPMDRRNFIEHRRWTKLRLFSYGG